MSHPAFNQGHRNLHTQPVMALVQDCTPRHIASMFHVCMQGFVDRNTAVMAQKWHLGFSYLYTYPGSMCSMLWNALGLPSQICSLSLHCWQHCRLLPSNAPVSVGFALLRHRQVYIGNLLTNGIFCTSKRSGRVNQSPSRAISRLQRMVSGLFGALQKACMPCVCQTAACNLPHGKGALEFTYLKITTSPRAYLYKRVLSLSTSILSFQFAPSGFKVGCIDLPLTHAGPTTRSLTVMNTGVSQAV